jgi:dTDP-4-dehydrorhamnose 3,5-epimerase
MLFTELELAGAFIVDLEHREDPRGFFARTFCRDEFEAHGLVGDFVQCNTSFNARRGTLRGLHFQHAPHEEIKLVRCTSGVILDVIVDLRPESATYCRWKAVELSAANGRALYIPRGFAHGFQTLADRSEVYYQMAERYYPGSAAGVRWDDPAFGIDWPVTPPILSDKDASYANFGYADIKV